MDQPTPLLRRKRQEENVFKVEPGKKNSLRVENEKSLKMDKEKSLKKDKEKSLNMDKEKSLETLWQEVQALDSSPNRPSSLSSQVSLPFTLHLCIPLFFSSSFLLLRFSTFCQYHLPNSPCLGQIFIHAS